MLISHQFQRAQSDTSFLPNTFGTAVADVDSDYQQAAAGSTSYVNSMDDFLASRQSAKSAEMGELGIEREKSERFASPYYLADN